jgi:hypothetical protein
MLQQRAERRSGQEALSGLEAAVVRGESERCVRVQAVRRRVAPGATSHCCRCIVGRLCPVPPPPGACLQAKYREALAAGLAAEAVPDASFGLVSRGRSCCVRACTAHSMSVCVWLD